MDDELLKLEAELKSLRPASVRPELASRVAREIQPRRTLTPMVRRLSWALPIAASVALLVAEVRRERHALVSDTPLQPAFKPVSAENVLLSSRDEGYVVLANGAPAHQLRQTYVDTITWKNPQTNASVVWSIPREEVQVIPVVYQ